MNTSTPIPRPISGSTRRDARCPAWGGLPRAWVLAAAGLLAGADPAMAQAPANDAFSGRLPVVGSTNTVTGTNAGASAEAGEPAHAGKVASASVWWSWAAPDSGLVTVETAGSDFDTVLAAYTGGSVEALSLVVSNDDAPGLATSQLTFPAVQGTTYQLAVDGFNGARGGIQLSVRLPVAPTPPTITLQPVSQHVPDQAGSNVTFAVTVAGSFPLSFEWQKDGTRLPGGTNVSYTVNHATQADAGQYRVVVRNAMGAAESSVATLAVRGGLAQDFFATPGVIGGQSQVVVVHNVGATTEPGEPRHAGVATGASVWWSWTAPQNGLVHLHTAGSTNALGQTLDTALAVYHGDRLDNLVPVASNNDEVPGLIRSSRLVFRARAGMAYRIAVAGLEDRSGVAAVGDLRLSLEQGADNDAFANALPIPPGATTVRDDNRGATVEPGEPRHAGNPGGRSVWWTWTAPSDGFYVADTVGSGIDTVLGVYTGDSLASVVCVAEDDSRAGAGASAVKFFARAGTRFQLVVDGHVAPAGVEAGPILLNLNPAGTSNDAFADRINLFGRTNRLAASNIGATKEPGEPDHGGNAGGRSVWWTWTAPATGPVLISTRGSAIDTALAVYHGTRWGALTLVGQNDDADPADPFAGSQVGFQAEAGQAYQVAVDGYRDEDGTVPEGDIVLTLVQADLPSNGSNDLFANRSPLTGQAQAAIGLNARASREPGEPRHAENDGGRSLWWSWVAPAAGPVTLNTVGSSFGTLLAAYQGDRVESLTLLDQDQGSAGHGWSIVTFLAEPGREYQIAVDGFNNGAGAEFGEVILTLRQFPDGPLHANDDFEDATPIADPFLNVKGSNIGATRQAGEPNHAGAEQGRSVWWTWTAPASGPVTMSTAGSQFDTLLSVYTGDALGSLRLVAENDDVQPFDEQSRVTFEAMAGQSYRIAVDGYDRQMGFIELAVAPRPDLAGAPEVQQQPVDQTRFLDGAGGDPEVVFRVGATGAPPLSFQWTHEGVELSGATNEVLTLGHATGPQAGVYQVRIRNAFGEVTSTPARLTFIGASFNDAFARRMMIEGAVATVRGSIAGATKQEGEPDHGGGAGGRSAWWRWVAPTSGPVEIHTFGSSFDTLLGVYEGDDVGTLVPVARNDDAVVGRVAASRVVFNAVAMREYQIAVDGHKTNSDGSVVLSVHQPVRVDPVPPSVTISAPSASLTRAGVVTYTVTYADANFDQSTLDASDILLHRTGTADGLVTVSGSGNTRLVTVFRITGDGTLGISLGAGTASDTAANLAPASSPSAVFEVDNTAPAVRLSAPVGRPGSGTVEYTVTYSDPNLLGNTLRAEDVRLHTTGTANGTIRVQGNGNTVLVTIASITGTGTVGISVAAGTAVDKAGNRAGAVGPGEPFEVLDLIAPEKPAVPRLLAGSDTGVTNTDRITAAAVITVVGSGWSGEVVTLHDGITVLGSTVVSAGAWSLSVSGLAQGDHDLTAVLTDSSGNRSVPSDPLRVRIDQTAPTVSVIPALTVGAGTALEIPFVVGDSQSDPADLSVQASSSSPSLLPDSGLVLSGTGPNRSLRVSPEASPSGGVVDITLTVRDVAGNAASPTLRLTVQAPNRPPTLDPIPGQTVVAGSGAQWIRLAGVTAGLGETQSLTLRAVSDNPALVAAPLAFLTLPVGSGALVLAPAASGSGTARIRVILSDDGGTAFGGVDTITNTFTVTVIPSDPGGGAWIQNIVGRVDGGLELTVVLPTGRPYVLQESTDLRSWAGGVVFTPETSPHRLIVTGSAGAPEKFFRVVVGP